MSSRLTSLHANSFVVAHCVQHSFELRGTIVATGPGRMCLMHSSKKETFIVPQHVATFRIDVPVRDSAGRPGQHDSLTQAKHAGGYKEDRWAQGCADNNAFSFWHWQCVELFIYFSHAMVTIPTVGWYVRLPQMDLPFHVSDTMTVL